MSKLLAARARAFRGLSTLKLQVLNAPRIKAAFVSTASSSTTVGVSSPQFSPTTDAETAAASLLKLVTDSPESWTLVSDGMAIERSFKFKTFTKAWDFMTSVALLCKVENHHPEWSNVYNTVYIRWTTHNPRGLSQKDTLLAAKCDAIARQFGELEPEPVNCLTRSLADQVFSTPGGDCCASQR